MVFLHGLPNVVICCSRARNHNTATILTNLSKVTRGISNDYIQTISLSNVQAFSLIGATMPTTTISPSLSTFINTEKVTKFIDRIVSYILIFVDCNEFIRDNLHI